LGKSKITPLEKASEDYAGSFRVLKDYADFFVVNVSSPNTPNLRQLQDREALSEILQGLQSINAAPAKPILVKIAPDLSFEALDEILELSVICRIAGIVATNTTVSRPTATGRSEVKAYAETGGLSGKPLRRRSTELVSHIHRQMGGRLPVIGVGGIFSAEDAWEKIVAGSSLIQIYTGMVYEGPSITAQIIRGLRRLLAEHGLSDLREAVGLNQR
jgi:dihydroorotate dehydrogenase